MVWCKNALFLRDSPHHEATKEFYEYFQNICENNFPFDKNYWELHPEQSVTQKNLMAAACCGVRSNHNFPD